MRIKPTSAYENIRIYYPIIVVLKACVPFAHWTFFNFKYFMTMLLLLLPLALQPTVGFGLIEQDPSIFSYLSPTLSIIVKSIQLSFVRLS
jgi:hypothetical protein